MSFFTPLFEKLKSHNYSVITAVVIGLLTALYLLIIIPNNELKEDANNLAVSKGIVAQLKGFFDDKLKEISPDRRDSLIAKNPELLNDSVFIDKIEIKSLKTIDTSLKELQLVRSIYFNKKGVLKPFQPIVDTVRFDLDEFISRIDNSSKFNSFLVCPVTVSDDKDKNGKCFVKDILISKNVSLRDEDSLALNNRSNGFITFKKSANRYYTSQLNIPKTNFTLFVASGINSSYFESNVHYIKPNLLMFSLLIVGVLFLSICFMKPIVSSYKERLSQMDLITVAFSTGALIALLVVFGMVVFWKKTFANRNKSDLKQLVEHIDYSFQNQINSMQSLKKTVVPFDLNKSQFPFRKLYLEKGTKVSLINGDSIQESSDFKLTDKTLVLSKNKFRSPESLDQIKSLDSYFWMDKDGLLTASLTPDNISFPRKYNDRNYFKSLQKKEEKIDTVLTGVFSRESNEYQWIYAQRDSAKDSINTTEKTAIKGIAFRENFSKYIKVPPDTEYMLVDKKGFVLMHNNRDKNLFQNVLSGSRNNLVLASILSGCDFQNFRMDYQGTQYQVYAKRLSVPTDSPVYILGMRSLSYLDYLSLFTFNNAFIITVVYGFAIVLLILGYSFLFYRGRLSFFSRYHFYHLFPDNSRKKEYQNLFLVNLICFSAVIVVFFFSSPITALYFCLLIGLNIAFVNVVVLNIRSNHFSIPYLKFYLIVFLFGIVLPLFILKFDQMYLSFFTLILIHIALILYYRNWVNWENKDTGDLLIEASAKNEGVQRKSYLNFITSGFVNHFVLFPFVLVCCFYSNEINEYARYYCSPPQPQAKVLPNKVINTYGCDCMPLSGFDLSKNNEGMIHKLNFGFEQPTMGEVTNFSLKTIYRLSYIKTNAVFVNLGLDLFYIILFFISITLLAYSILNYYCNRFFFFDLMQASHEGFYPDKENSFSNDYDLLTMLNSQDFNKLIQKDLFNYEASTPESESVNSRSNRSLAIDTIFDRDTNGEILPYFRKEFILEYNLKKFDKIYSEKWNSITDTQMQNVLFDFAQDHFINYKNKDMLMQLMDLGFINHDKITGRLKVMNYSFRMYILSKSKKDTQFVKQFEDESKNGTFDKFKLPILIAAISFLVLLMYLNKDSYEKVMILGSSIGSVILLINKFLDFGKVNQ